MIACYDVRREDLDYEAIRERFREWRSTAEDLLLGDYYPLTSYSLEMDAWIAWQFDRPELGRGSIQAFRREDSVYEVGRFPLRGVEPEAQYRITDVDADGPVVVTGAELLDPGLRIEVTDRPGAALIIYERVND